MVYWLVVGPPGNWETALQHRIWGLPARYETTWQRMGPGDQVVFYATSPVTGLIGCGSIARTLRGDAPIWEQERAEGRALWPLRLDLRELLSLHRRDWEDRCVPVDPGLVLQRSVQLLPNEEGEELVERVREAVGRD